MLAIWLTGSLARGEEDPWSSVDLCLLIGDRGDFPAPSQALEAALRKGLGEDAFVVAAPDQGAGAGRLVGAMLEDSAALPGKSGLTFQLFWAEAAQAERLRARHGPVRLLYTADALPASLHAYLSQDFPPLLPAEAEAAEAALIEFWEALLRLPGALNRRDHLAAGSLLAQARNHLVDAIVAVNGGRRPPASPRANRYLGPSQQEALARTLVCPAPTSETWIGQAVALVVIYRWYAPQLQERFPQLKDLTRMETITLALLTATIDDWPAHITTETE
ncbi:MAG: nucleotidyltransferase domain-containing protein [Caldilineae bacterium]|nr:MAG: nucleotidyltransferase domain-containing protein [Caldilineae bacterium]